MTEQLAPLTVVTGSEELLVERAVRELVASVGSADEVELHEIDATMLAPGQLAVQTSPSLFGGPPVVVLQAIEALVQSKSELDEAIEEILSYLKSPSPDACVVLVHAGGNGGKAVLAAAKKAGASVINTPAPKKRSEIRSQRREFVREEFRRRQSSISPQAVEALVDAVGTDLRDLAGACAQLADDRVDEGRIEEADVRRYYDGRAEVQTFDVADRVVAGHTAEALGLFRHARDAGVPVILFPAALARTLRQLALVASAPRGASAVSIAAAAEIPDWKVRAVRDTARHWTDAGLVTAIRAVAEADAAVKGGEADPDYALERMLITVGRSRTRA
ncbi:MAG TPA: DNA polymerase III subunit delta [Actinomycetes bacterium]|nr:DNA polymerase III subunit delta [Actinomycetes bacterium]